jgi:hypothetical protein
MKLGFGARAIIAGIVSLVRKHCSDQRIPLPRHRSLAPTAFIRRRAGHCLQEIDTPGARSQYGTLDSRLLSGVDEEQNHRDS